VQIRKFIAALVVLGLLLAWVWKLGEPAQPSEPEALTTRLFPQLSGSSIQSFQLGEEGKAIRLSRQKFSGDAAEALGRIGIGETLPSSDLDGSARRSAWVVVRDPSRFADGDLSESLAETLAEMSWHSTLPAPPDLSQFGLGTGATEVAFKTRGGASHKLRIGSESPLGGKRYVFEAASGQVHLVDSWALRGLERDPQLLLEQRIFPFDVARIVSLRIERPEASALHLVRHGRSWLFAEQDGLRAESTWVKKILRGLSGLRAASFLSIEGEFASPIWVQIIDIDGHEGRLEIAPEDQGRIYQARSSGDLLPQAFAGLGARIEAVGIDPLFADADSIRALDMLDFNPGAVQRIEWQTQGSLWTFEREGKRWTLQAGQSAATEAVDPAAVEQFLDSLNGLRAQSYSTGTMSRIDAGSASARVTIEQQDGHRVGLQLYQDGLHDLVAIDDEPGLRDVGTEVRELLSAHGRFARDPQKQEDQQQSQEPSEPAP
jgi:hypothetical protein